MVFGELTTKASLDFQRIVRETVKEIGYDSSEKGLNYRLLKGLITKLAMFLSPLSSKVLISLRA